MAALLKQCYLKQNYQDSSRMRTKILTLLKVLIFTLLFSVTAPIMAQSDEDPLPANQAFKLIKAYTADNQSIIFRWHVQPKYYLYEGRFQFDVLNPNSVKLGSPQFPRTTLFKTYPDGRKMRVYSGKFNITVPLEYSEPLTKPLQISVKYQGCSELGICYPQQTRTFAVALAKHPTKPNKLKTPTPTMQQDYLTTILTNQHFFTIIAVFFGLGLLLSLTPCVLPMIPILSSIIMGQKHITHLRSFLLSLAYVLGMAISYAVLGLFVGMAGNSIQAALQKPWIISLFTLLIALMAFSLFGFFNLQLPEFIRGPVAKISNHQKHGSFIGAGIMGVLSTLILSPCVTPALATAILYIAKTGDAVIGASALFSMGIGMGVLLLMVGASSAKLLPKTGGWMNAIKIFLGFVMLAVAIWTISRILPSPVNMLLWSLLAIAIAVTLRTFQGTHTKAQHLGKAFGLLFFIYGILLIMGAILGQNNPLNPIPLNAYTEKSALKFQRVVSLPEFQQQLQRAKALHKPIVLDFYADWCVECQKMDAYTFSNPELQSLLKPYLRVRADVTENSLENQALEKHYGVIAPPTLLFFTPDGTEIRSHRVVGEISADKLIKQLQSLDT